MHTVDHLSVYSALRLASPSHLHLVHIRLILDQSELDANIDMSELIHF